MVRRPAEQGHPFPPRSISCGLRCRPLWVALLGSLALSCGCGLFKAKTSRMQQIIEDSEAAEDAAKKLEEENRKRNEKLEKERTELEKQAKQLEKQIARDKMRREAAALLAEGDAQGALDVIAKILDPDPEIVVDGAGVETMVEVPPPEFEPQEEARIRLIEGTAQNEIGQRDKAVETLRKALELDPSLRDARRNLGQILFLARDYEGALAAWLPELADGYRDGKLLFLVAQARYEIYHKTKNAAFLESARAALHQVIVESPDDPEVTRWLAIVEYESGRYEEAIRLFEVIRTTSPLDPEYLELLANSYIQIEDYARATDYLELAATVKTPSRSVMKTLGDLFVTQGLPDRAAEWLVKACGEDPNAPGAEPLLIGMLFSEAGKTDHAIRWLEAIPRTYDDYEAAQTNLAYLYQDLGRSDDALGAYENAGDANPDNGFAHLAVADIYLDRKEYDKAYAAYSKASALPDTNADGLAGLAEVEYAKENLPAAIKYYGQALEARPGDPRFEAAHREISEEHAFREQLAADSGAAAE